MVKQNLRTTIQKSTPQSVGGGCVPSSLRRSARLAQKFSQNPSLLTCTDFPIFHQQNKNRRCVRTSAKNSKNFKSSSTSHLPSLQTGKKGQKQKLNDKQEPQVQPQPQPQPQPQQRVRRSARLQAKQATQKSPAPPRYEEAGKKEMRPAPAPVSASLVAPTRPLKSCLKKPNSANVAAPQKQKRVTWWDDREEVENKALEPATESAVVQLEPCIDEKPNGDNVAPQNQNREEVEDKGIMEPAPEPAVAPLEPCLDEKPNGDNVVPQNQNREEVEDKGIMEPGPEPAVAPLEPCIDEKPNGGNVAPQNQNRITWWYEEEDEEDPLLEDEPEERSGFRRSWALLLGGGVAFLGLVGHVMANYYFG